jgi:hypothetical protein
MLFKQITEIIDDATESEYYYLTVQLYEYLLKNLNKMVRFTIIKFFLFVIILVLVFF